MEKQNVSLICKLVALKNNTWHMTQYVHLPNYEMYD